MKKLISLLCALCMLCALPGACRAQGEKWSAEEWEKVVEALASDQQEPVPEKNRVRVNARQLSVQKPTEQGRYMNVLLASTDSEDMERNFGRTELLLVCRVDLLSGDTRVLSLPAYGLVSLPELPEAVALRYVNCFGGPMLAMRALNETLGLSLNKYMAVNMEDFVGVVDYLGGVTMTLDEEEAQALELEPGERRLTGAQALAYARLRREGDYAGRSRALLEALLGQMTASSTVTQVLSMVDMLLPVTDTNLTTDDVIDLVFALFGQESPVEFKAQGLKPNEENVLDRTVEVRALDFLYARGESQ